MEFQFQLAKNNEETVCVNNCFLHSSYDPSKEAKRFVDNININYIPEYILIIEPALSYCVKFLKEKFPNSKIGVLRIEEKFYKYNDLFDFSFDFTENFETIFSSSFSEEQLLKMYFVTWKNSENIYKDQINTLTVLLSKILNKAKTELVTRQYFEKKWFINSINFIKYLSKPVYFNELIQKPILILSSGPSLADSIPIIKEYRKNFFIICLSSCISVCNFYEIIPDMYMSTDGGYWAGQHLKKLNKDIPLALPLEGYCNKSLLKNNKILPLKYNDSLLNDYLNSSDLKFIQVERNGTVSGTALKFALNYSKMPVFLCGIDMSSQKGFQHTQPNELELNNSIIDNKINNKTTRLTRSEFSSGSLEIYKNWFDQLKTDNREIYRVINKKYKRNTLGPITDIETDMFSQIIINYKDKYSNIKYIEQKNNYDYKKLIPYIDSMKNSKEWENHFFPLDMVSLSYNPSNQELIDKITVRKNNFLSKIGTILND